MLRSLVGSEMCIRDREFRYLRTVIVTAAVYRGFGSKLAPLPLTFRHRAGVRPYTSSCDLAEPCVFSKQSLPPALCPPPAVARGQGLLLPKLRRQFAEFLQHRSLKRLGILYHPTCVGLGYGLDARAVSWNFFTARSNPISPDNLRSSSHLAGPGILTWFPSTTPFGLALGAGLPCSD